MTSNNSDAGNGQSMTTASSAATGGEVTPNDSNAGNSQKKKKSGGSTKDPSPATGSEWPWWGQFILAMFAMVLAALFLIGLPYAMTVAIENPEKLHAADVWTAMIPTLMGLTTMTISGIFVFMTFRIDRGARAEAQKTANKAVAEAVDKGIQLEVEKKMDEYLGGRMQGADRQLESRMKGADRQLESRMKEVDRQLGNRMKEVDRQLEARSEAADKFMEMRLAAIDERLTERFEDADARITRHVADADKQITGRIADAENRIAETIRLGRSSVNEKGV